VPGGALDVHDAQGMVGLMRVQPVQAIVLAILRECGTARTPWTPAT
jgi:hypothetical protein